MNSKKSNEIVLVRNNLELTNRIKEKTGEKVRSAKRIRNYYKEDTTDYRQIYYVINWKFLVTLYLDKETGKLLDEITVEDYMEKISIQKEFGLRVEHLSVIANVPWNVAELVGHILDDNEALHIIEELKRSKKNVTKQLKYELYSGSNSRLNAIKKILGDNLFDKIRITTNRQTMALADFLSL